MRWGRLGRRWGEAGAKAGHAGHGRCAGSHGRVGGSYPSARYSVWGVPGDCRRVHALNRLHDLAVPVEEESRLGVGLVLLELLDLLRIDLVPLDLLARHLPVAVQECREHRFARAAPVGKDLHDAPGRKERESVSERASERACVPPEWRPCRRPTDCRLRHSCVRRHQQRRPLVHGTACRKPLTASPQSSPCTIAHSSSVVNTVIVGPSTTLGGMVAARLSRHATTEVADGGF